MRTQEEHYHYHDIVIIGAGISGLATALALHRKGIKSLVLERSDSLRIEGGAVSVFRNGWQALEQLGVAESLRAKSIQLTEVLDEWTSPKTKTVVTPISKEEMHCVIRKDIVETLFDSLPTEYIRFGCRVVALEADPITSFPVILTEDGGIIRAKVLIGCDGVNSIVAKALGLKAATLATRDWAQGITSYADGHNFGSQFFRKWGDNILLARFPLTDKTVFWFVLRQVHPMDDSKTYKYPNLIRKQSADLIQNWPEEVTEMVKLSDLSLINLVRCKYRAPWDLVFSNFSRGTIAVAGDALHPMDPGLGQGGCVGIEDALVLARCLAQEHIGLPDAESDEKMFHQRAIIALKKYESERWLRVLLVSTKSYLIGAMNGASRIKKLVLLIIFILLGGRYTHTQFNCGSL